jgi:hypothetical protein
MTPDELNQLVRDLATALRNATDVTDAQLIVPADDEGTPPEIGVTCQGVDLALTVEVM